MKKDRKKILLLVILPIAVIVVYILSLFVVGRSNYCFPTLRSANTVLYFVFFPMLFLVPIAIVVCLIGFFKQIFEKFQKLAPKWGYVILYALYIVFMVVFFNVCCFEVLYHGIYYSNTKSMNDYLVADEKWITEELSEYFPNKEQIDFDSVEYNYSYSHAFEDPNVDVTLKLTLDLNEYLPQSTLLLNSYGTKVVTTDENIVTITIFNSQAGGESGLIEKEFAVKEKKIILNNMEHTITYQYVIYHI